jgi:hypothetical protein
MSRFLTAFVRNVYFTFDRNRVLTARIPMPVEGTWQIASTQRDPLSGDMIVTFRPSENPLVEAERPALSPGRDPECRFEAWDGH